MKKLQIITAFCLMLLMSGTLLFAQNGQYDVRLSNARDNCSGSKYYVDIEVKATSSTTTFNMSDQNYRLSFNRAALENPFVAQELTISGLTNQGGAVTFYDPHTVLGSVDTVLSYNVVLAGGVGFPVTSTEWVPVGRVGFDRISNLPPEFRIHDDQPANFPPTFVGEKFNNTLYKADIGVLTSAQTSYSVDAGPDVALSGTGVQIGSTANDAYTAYQWTPSTGLADPTASSTTANPSVTTTYTICGTSLGCTTCDDVTVTVGNNPGNAVMVDLNVWLEGPYNETANQMNTYLNKKAGSMLHRGVLPGQTPLQGQVVIQTPAGQPYNIQPFNYAGKEGANWDDSNYEQIKQTYGADVVDWILVSFRSDFIQNTALYKAVGLLLEDGRIVFLQPITTTDLNLPANNSVYIVVQHRNHMLVMSHVAVALVNNSLTYDFRAQDSYKANSTGQKQLANGQWVMIAGEIDPGLGGLSDDINGLDRIQFLKENGTFDQYSKSDLSMNADVSGADLLLFNQNNGYSSRVPR